MMTLKQIAESLAKELGASHRIFSSYAVKQTPQRTMPLLQLIELYVSLLGEQAFVETYYEADCLYVEENGFLKRVSNSSGWIQIYHESALLASGQI